MNSTWHDLLAVQHALNAIGDQAAADAPIRATLADLAMAMDALIAEQSLIIARLMHANDRLYSVARQMADNDPRSESLLEALNSVRWALYPELAEELLAAQGIAALPSARLERKSAAGNPPSAPVAESHADPFQRDALDLANRVRLAKLRYRED
ncbi:MAG: hypothetical protein LM550_10475 [Candidatus Contendobacter sp.]|nr:hypothetical protein [Gammaproteobacteria bacterium]MCC8994090.1 hypothetical protein [Candidatus Contendobacter sp.]